MSNESKVGAVPPPGEPCEQQAWINVKTSHTQLIPVCSELWSEDQERLINAGTIVPLVSWLQKNHRDNRHESY